MSQTTAPLQELSTAQLVVIEAPPITVPRFEHDFLAMIQKIRTLGPEVAVIVQPSVRRKSNKTLWVLKWNNLHHAPFRFYQTCSCQTGNTVKGCHLTCLVGTSSNVRCSPCSEVPTSSATSTASVVSLGGTINYVSVLCRPMTAAVGSQQVPDSVVHPIPMSELRRAQLKTQARGAMTLEGIPYRRQGQIKSPTATRQRSRTRQASAEAHKGLCIPP